MPIDEDSGTCVLHVLNETHPRREGPSPSKSESQFDPSLDQVLPGREVDLVVVTEELRLLTRQMAFSVIELALRGAAVSRLSEFLGAPDWSWSNLPGRNVVENLLAVIRRDCGEHRVQRVIDVIFGSLGLLVFALPFVLIGLAIKLDSRGPVFFVQERLGRMRVPFPCIKFRTMHPDAEKGTGPVWARVGDPRITRVGRFLRRTRIDELPQLINVVRGDMSLIGNRPIRQHFADQLAEQVPFYDLRFLEKPGLTGWAQVKYRYASSFAEQIEKLNYECYYLKNRSLSLDIRIVLLTVWVVLVGQPAQEVRNT